MLHRKLSTFLSCALFFLCITLQFCGAVDNPGVQTKTWEQELRSFNSKTLINMEFPKGKWEYCVIKVNGHWEKDPYTPTFAGVSYKGQRHGCP